MDRQKDGQTNPIIEMQGGLSESLWLLTNSSGEKYWRICVWKTKIQYSINSCFVAILHISYPIFNSNAAPFNFRFLLFLNFHQKVHTEWQWLVGYGKCQRASKADFRELLFPLVLEAVDFSAASTASASALPLPIAVILLVAIPPTRLEAPNRFQNPAVNFLLPTIRFQWSTFHRFTAFCSFPFPTFSLF